MRRLRDYKVSCSIINGNRYSLQLNGTGHKPRLDLSFMSHDFAACPVFQTGMTPSSKLLRLSNSDTQPISVDPQFTVPPAHAGCWALEAQAGVLQPGESRDYVMTFTPTAAVAYAVVLPLEVNGLYTVNVEFKGEGSVMRVELVNPLQHTVQFGPVTRGTSSTRVVALVNRGRTAVTLSAAPSAEMLKRWVASGNRNSWEGQEDICCDTCADEEGRLRSRQLLRQRVPPNPPTTHSNLCCGFCQGGRPTYTLMLQHLYL